MYGKIFLVTLLLGVIYLYIQNYLHTISYYKLFIAQLDRSLKGKKIVFISDTHFRNKNSIAFTDRILLDIEKQKPDLILFGGDIVHNLKGEQLFEHVKDFFFQLNKIAPTYVIYGNHDLATNQLNELNSMLELAGVTLLENEAVWISFDDSEAGFWLLGLQGLSSTIRTMKDPLQKISLPQEKQDEVKILLAHHPEVFENYLKDKQKRPQLTLSGHTHGGQAIIPFLGGLFAPGQGFLPKYDFGLFTNQHYPNSRMIVTRGLGNSRFPFRLNNRPEIVVIEFE